MNARLVPSLLLLVSLLPAQGSSLELAIADVSSGTGGWITNADIPYGAWKIQSQVTGEAGTWTYLLGRVFVPDAILNGGGSAAAAGQAALAQFGQLEEPDPVLHLNGWTRQHISQWNLIHQRSVMADGDAVKGYCQPILESSTGGTSNQPRIWDLRPPVWYQQGVHSPVRLFWKALEVADAGNSLDTDGVRLAEHCVERQYGRHVMRQMFSHPTITAAIGEGALVVEVQAFGVRNPHIEPDTTDYGAPGLGADPELEFTISGSSRFAVTPAPRIGDSQAPNGGGYTGVLGRALVLPFDQGVGTLSAVLVQGANTVTVYGSLLSIGWAKFDIPSSMGTGIWEVQSLSNPFVTELLPPAGVSVTIQ